MRNCIVFGGGGGKGAYQIGVWKALKENGIDGMFDTVIGTSVGALNAALFTQGDIGIAEDVWNSISNDKILTSEKIIGNSFFTQTGLKSIIKIRLSEKKIRSSKNLCYVCTTCTDHIENMISMCGSVNLGGSLVGKISDAVSCCITNNAKIYGKYFLLNELDDETMCNALLASAALPVVFDPVRIQYHTYRDGGLIAKNNVPYLKAIDLGCRRVLSIPLEQGVPHQECINGTKIFHLSPTKNIGGMTDGVIDFSSSGARYRMKVGYCDALTNMKKIKELLEISSKKVLHVTREEIDRLFR